jgi:hypothetical protein
MYSELAPFSLQKVPKTGDRSIVHGQNWHIALLGLEHTETPREGTESYEDI